MSDVLDDNGALRWSGSLAVVLLVHGLLVGAALWWQSTSPAQPVPAPADAVMLELAPVATAPLAAPTELAPGPTRQEQRKDKPKPQQPPEKQPEPEVVKPKTPPPEVQVSKPQPDAELAAPLPAAPPPANPGANANVDQTTAPPATQAAPDSRYAAPQTLSGNAHQVTVTWQAQLLGHLQKYKRYPRAAQQRRQEGVAQVRFAVDRQGRVSGIRLARSSGHDLLDTETLATVERAAPLPPPPPEVPGDPVEVLVPVEFFLRR